MYPAKAILVASMALLAFPALSAAHPITVGGAPWAVAVDPVTGMAYVSNYDSDTVSVIDESTEKVVSTIPVGQAPEALAVNPTTDMIYVTDFFSQSVSVINGSTDKVTATIEDVGLNPNSIAVDAATDTVYVGIYMSSTVDVIDGATNTITTEISVPDANIHDVVVDPTTDMVYASAYNLNYVAEISTTTNSMIGELTGLCGPNGLAIDTATNTLYVANNYCDYGVATYSDGVSTGFMPSKNPPDYMAVAPGGEAFATFAASSRTGCGAERRVAANGYVLGYSDSRVAGIHFVGNTPCMLDVDPNTDDVFVANYGGDTVSEFHG